jgi:outer membrane protein OmpA-like peptidoglycan-associated protein
MRKYTFLVFVLITAVLVQVTSAQQIDYLTAKPMSQVVKVSAKPFKQSGAIPLPLITWGGDIATIQADIDGIFQQEDLKISLFREDNFAKQVEMCLSGQTPYLRGTMGMINAAADAFKVNGQELVVIYQLTWSTGGDAMVVRSGKTLKNIKSVALQLYGPHIDYSANLFKNAGRLEKVTFKYLQELTLPSYDTKRVVDPVSAFQVDPSIDAVMCIIPDALMLTSGGNVGTGAEGSVKGAKILLSTKTASRIIADVYTVRKDYFDSHRTQVQNLVHTLMRGEESLRDLRKNKSVQQAKYRQLLSKSADILLGAPQATADVEALLGDCEYVGYAGNIAFFTGKGTTRTLETLTNEIQGSFSGLGLISQRVPLHNAGWDYATLASGLKYATDIPTVKKKFDPKKVAKKVEEKIAVEPTIWEEEGTLFVVEINFEPNQTSFPTTKYAGDFKKAVEIAQTYGGSLIVIEGHSDPLGILKSQQKGERQQVIQQMKQKAKNLSLQRAGSVRGNFLTFAKSEGIVIDESQFVAIGLGTESPKFNPPRTKEEWAANRRVVFRIKEVEAELSEFEPL